MMRLDDGQLARRDWSAIATDVLYLAVLVGGILSGIFAVHPHGAGRVALPLLLAVAALNLGGTIKHLAVTWRDVVVLVEPADWPAAEELGGRPGGRR
jgi:hypothetical protein